MSEAASQASRTEPAAGTDSTAPADRTGIVVPIVVRQLTPREDRVQAAMDTAVHLAVTIPASAVPICCGNNDDDNDPSAAFCQPAVIPALASSRVGEKRRRSPQEGRVPSRSSAAIGSVFGSEKEDNDASDGIDSSLLTLLLRSVADSDGGRWRLAKSTLLLGKTTVRDAIEALHRARAQVRMCAIALKSANGQREALKVAQQEATAGVARARSDTAAEEEARTRLALQGRLQAVVREELILSALIERTSDADMCGLRLQKEFGLARMKAAGGGTDTAAALVAAQAAIDTWGAAAGQRAADAVERDRRLSAAERDPASSAAAIRSAVAAVGKSGCVAQERHAASVDQAIAAEYEAIRRTEQHLRGVVKPANGRCAHAAWVNREAEATCRRLVHDTGCIVEALSSARCRAVDAINAAASGSLRGQSALVRLLQYAVSTEAPTG